MKIEILVVRVEEELLFQSGDLFFDYLSAYEEFYDGKLTIKRDGEVYDQTTWINEYGTHGAGPCFMGLKKFPSAISVLLPRNFQEGDLLTLEIPASEKFSFNGFLAIKHLQYTSLMAAFKRMPSGTIGAFQPVLAEELQKKAKEFLQNPNVSVLRWRNA